MLGACLVMGLATGVAAGQKTVTKMGDKVTLTATIVLIDQTDRLVTFKSADGSEDTVVAGPDVKRFSELKVGDKVNMTYYESMVFQVRKPGTPASNVKDGAMTTVSKTKMAGTISDQETTTVTVKAVDPKVPSITVTTAGGRTISRKIADKKDLNGVKAGDKIDITYTQAVLVSVEPPK
jgi:hypothetical protein